MQYHELDQSGYIHYIKGNNMIKITTPVLIYFYKIDETTSLPSLQNCMYNYMECTVLMFASQNKYCISYKTGQIGFMIYRRKYHHKFLAELSDTPYFNCQACSISSSQQYMVTVKQKVYIFEQNGY